MQVHEPALLKETLEALNIEPHGTYVDCTYGRGGHTREILARLSDAGRIIAIDRDPSAVESAAAVAGDPRVTLIHARFSHLEQLLEQRQLPMEVSGILMDLGVSSPQLDDPDRGFSFRARGPLDMRMDPTSGPSAAEWLAAVSERDLRACLKTLGEERYAGRIARKIVEQRKSSPITTTLELADLVRAAVPTAERRLDPATRTFQALRLRVNGELEELSNGLRQASQLLARGGRIAVIAFHSLEDRIVKRYFRDLARHTDAEIAGRAYQVLTRKPIRASAEEIIRNARVRSARLRVLARVQ